jgi:hypothetical protein
MPAALVSIFMQILFKLISQKAIEQTVLLGLKALAKSTDNQVDDELVQIIEEAFNPSPKSETIK